MAARFHLSLASRKNSAFTNFTQCTFASRLRIGPLAAFVSLLFLHNSRTATTTNRTYALHVGRDRARQCEQGPRAAIITLCKLIIFARFISLFRVARCSAANSATRYGTVKTAQANNARLRNGTKEGFVASHPQPQHLAG